MDGRSCLALAGEGMVGRLAASLLVHGGHAELVANDLDGYLKIASAQARKGPRDQAQRLKLRQSVQNSALADGLRLSKELELHYFKLREKSRPANNFSMHLSESSLKMFH